MVPKSVFVSAVFALLLADVASASDVVFIRDGSEEGQALLRRRGEDCFAVTMAHVTPFDALEANVGHELTPANVVLRSPATNPVASVLKIIASGCENTVPWPDALDVRTALKRTTGRLEFRQPSGTLKRIRVTVTTIGQETIQVEPAMENDTLAKGMSGGTVYVGDTPVALLNSVERYDRGTAYRLDYIDRLLTSFFEIPVACSDGCEAVVANLPVARRYQTVSGNSALSETTTIETVYRVPADWPTEPFLHIEILTTTSRIGTGTPVSITGFGSAAFASTAGSSDADTLFLGALSITGTEFTIFFRNKQMYSAVLSGSANGSDLRITVKPAVDSRGR